MAGTITTSVVTGGSNSHASTVSEINAFRSDFALPGATGTITNTAGVSPATGSFAVNQQGSPAMFVDVSAGACYITATPAGQLSQLLRAYSASTWTSYAISANASGSTKFDWIYLSVDATKANNPASDASDVTALYTSRSSSNTVDNGTPPTYGTLLAVVTVANGASSISNASISDRRVNASLTAISTGTTFFDFVESGCVWSGDSYASTLNASMTAGFVWIAGVRLRVGAVTARAFTASKDTYIDLSNNGDGTAAITYTPATNNAASSALSAGSVRIGIIVTGASNIAAAGSVNQGQETMVLPIASSVPYAVTDSLGNLICPRDPNRKLLGYRQILSSFTTSSATQVQITGLSCTVTIPSNRKIKITLYCGQIFGSVGADTVSANIWDGVVASGTSLNAGINAANQTGISMNIEAITTPATASKTYNAGLSNSASHSTTFQAASNQPAYIKVELE